MYHKPLGDLILSINSSTTLKAKLHIIKQPSLTSPSPKALRRKQKQKIVDETPTIRMAASLSAISLRPLTVQEYQPMQNSSE
jgi:hypothetical protein